MTRDLGICATGFTPVIRYRASIHKGWLAFAFSTSVHSDDGSSIICHFYNTKDYLAQFATELGHITITFRCII